VAGLVILALSARGPAAHGQRLPPKTAIGSAVPSGCVAYGSPPSAPPRAADDAEARRLIADGQEAALLGEHARARDLFARAVERSPASTRAIYYLAREHEALADGPAAVRQYCRYLSLAPNAADAVEIRGRIGRLVTPADAERIDRARAEFRSGVTWLERGQFATADSAFGSIIGQLPDAPEAYYNRALARAVRGRRVLALSDFERYLELSPGASDRVAIRAAMATLPDRVYDPASALLSSAIPGLGQINTGRPILGVVVLGAVAGAAAYALWETVTIRPSQCLDPNGLPYSCPQRLVERPHLVAGLALGGGVWLGSAWEAVTYASRSRARAESLIQPPGDRPRADGQRARP
jgi:tetratricopeptide (TPR) repeat protein